MTELKQSGEIQLDKFGKYQQPVIQDFLVCANNESTTYSKITASTREQSFSNASNNPIDNIICHTSENINNSASLMIQSPQRNDAEKRFMNSKMSLFDFNQMNKLQCKNMSCHVNICRTSPIKINTPENKSVSKVLSFPSDVKSKKVVLLNNASPQVQENIKIKKKSLIFLCKRLL